MQKNPFHGDIHAVKSFLKSWETLAPEEIKFERLAGLTNLIWKVTSSNEMASPSAIIYRKFGNTGSIIDRDKENYVFNEVSKYGLGPSCYGFTDSYRIEEFYMDSRTLHYTEINKKMMRRNLAKSVANFHKIELPKFDKKPMFLRVLEDRNLIKMFEEKCEGGKFSPVEQKFLQEIQALTSEDEIYFLKEILPKKSKDSIVFTHNDLHAQNVLLLNQTNKLVIIDYDYSEYNYRAYDIANLFNESIINYGYEKYPYYTIEEKNYPSDYDIIDFIKYYLFFFRYGDNLYLDEQMIINDESLMKKIIEDSGDQVKEFNLEVELLFEEVKVCTIFTHYYWILWSVIVSKNPDIQFDYIHYAYSRYRIYERLKQELYSDKSSNIEMILNN